MVVQKQQQRIIRSFRLKERLCAAFLLADCFVLGKAKLQRRIVWLPRRILFVFGTNNELKETGKIAKNVIDRERFVIRSLAKQY